MLALTGHPRPRPVQRQDRSQAPPAGPGGYLATLGIGQDLAGSVAPDLRPNADFPCLATMRRWTSRYLETPAFARVSATVRHHPPPPASPVLWPGGLEVPSSNLGAPKGKSPAEAGFLFPAKRTTGGPGSPPQ